jgi:mycofactocin precursor
MSETVTQDLVEETEQVEQTAEVEPIVEPLIEEVSIDGMCGVY